MPAGLQHCTFWVRTNHEIPLQFSLGPQDTQLPRWTGFVVYKSNNFTYAGVERLNDGIRPYVLAVQGSQAQTHMGILGTKQAFDAQRQFLSNVEDAINSPVDVGDAISRYENVLSKAQSDVDYVFGQDMFMTPSNIL